jgi:WD40 repeat protein/serine/threonine protein kinase
MTCPSAERLEAFLEEKLAGAERDALAGHVTQCASCQASLESLTEIPETLRDPLGASHASAPAEMNGNAAAFSFLGQLKNATDSLLRGQAARSEAPPNIPGYEILSELGRGGMGIVYRARHLGLNRIVALKMILAGARARPQDLVRFRYEAEAIAQLHHPNIVQIFDFGEAEGHPFFALEYVEGGNLGQHQQGVPMSPYEAAQMVETLARAIQFAHERGIVHRDLKPANVLLHTEGAEEAEEQSKKKKSSPAHSASGKPLVPKITDFGLAKRVDESVRHTVTGEMLGTPSYMAPEQAGAKEKDQAVGPAADVYALGAILFELLTGRPPFKEPTALETVMRVVHQEPPRPTRFQPYLPRDIETICLKCLEKSPSRRYRSAAMLADDLRNFQSGDSIHARPVGPPERAWKYIRRRPLTAALFVGIVVTAALGLAGIASQWREKEGAIENERFAVYQSRIAQSQLHWRLNDFPTALRTLNACAPEAGQKDQRGWEWHYLNGLYSSELLTLDHRRRGTSGTVAVDPQGRWIASVLTGHGKVRFWDASGGAYAFSLPASATARRLAFRPDGARLAVADDDGWVVVWDLGTRKELKRHRPHTQPINSLVFNANGELLATASSDGTVLIWDAQTGKEIRRLEGHADRANAVAFSPNGKRWATADQSGTVRIWDAKGGERPLHALPKHKSAVFGLAYSPDGKYLASAGGNGTLRIWDRVNNVGIAPRVVQSLTGKAGAVFSVAFSPDGRFLAHGGSDATVRVWHLSSGVELMIYRGHKAPIESVRFSPNGRRLISCSPEDGTVKIWDFTRHPEHSTLARTSHPEYPGAARAGIWPDVKVWDLLRGQTGPEPAQTGPDIEALAFQDDGRRLVSLTVDGKLQTWDTDSGLLLDEQTIQVETDLISPAVLADFAPGGQLLAARANGAGNGAEKEKLVKIWSVRTARETRTLRGHRLPVFAVRFSPDANRLATVGCDRSASGHPHEVIIWDVRSGARLARLEGRGHVFSLVFSPDSRWLALGDEAGNVRVLNWSNGKQVLGGNWHSGAVTSMAFLPRKGFAPLLATSGAGDRAVTLWDCKNGQEVARMEAPDLVCDLAFSKDGRRLAGISRDQVRLWDVRTGHHLLTLSGAPQRHRDPAFNPRLVFSPDGGRLAGSNWNESISLWEAVDLDPGRQNARLQSTEKRAALWHLEEAERCVRIKNLWAANLHLRWVGSANLPRPLQDRKDHLAQVLGQ